MFTYLYASLFFREFITLLTTFLSIVGYFQWKIQPIKTPNRMLYVKYDSLPVDTQQQHTGSPALRGPVC